MFITALITAVKAQKQPKWPQIYGKIKKICQAYTMEYYSAFKKNKIM